MLQLALSYQEQEALVKVLKSSMTELRTEVARTDRLAYRERLKGQAQSIKRTLSRLDQS